jgi:hypothetical protein
MSKKCAIDYFKALFEFDFSLGESHFLTTFNLFVKSLRN